MDSKKKFSVCAVFVMLFAGCACILSEGEDVAVGSSTYVNPSDDPIFVVSIDSTGKLTGDASAIGAKYDENKHILSFDKDFEVTCKNVNGFIHSEYNGLVIEINADIVLSATDLTSSVFSGIAFSKGGNAKITGIGSLTMNLPYAPESVCGLEIVGSDVDLEYIRLTINSPTKAVTDGYCAIYASANSEGRKSFNITRADLLLDSSRYPGSGEKDAAFHYRITVTMENSNMEIRMGKAIGMNVLTQSGVSRLTLASSSIKMTGTGTDIPYAMQIFSRCELTDSSIMMDVKGKCGISALKEGDTGMTLTRSILSMKLGDDATTGIDLSYGENSSIDFNESSVSIEGASKTAINVLSVRMTNSDVNIKSTTGKALAYTTFICTAEKVLGSNDGKEPTKEITEEPKTYAWIHVVSPMCYVFDLGEGTGTMVKGMKGYVGMEIVLPECDATCGDKVFVGWSDGHGLYQPGDRYPIVISTVFVAIYGEPTPEPSNGSGVDMTVVIASIAIAAVVIGILSMIFFNRRY